MTAAILVSILACLLHAAPEAAAQPCQSPNMLIVLDVSTSMTGTISGTTKWAAAKASVIGVANKYGTAASANKIRFGLELFANPDAYSHTKCCGPFGGECTSCGDLFCSSCGTHSHTQADEGICTVNAINVGVADNNASSIVAKLNQSQVEPWSTTPIAGALNFANTYSALKDGTRSNFVLLVTDGVEECEVSAGTYCTMCVSAATSLKSGGVKTFVVGFGSGVDVNNLNDMATAGGTAKAGATKYYQADNQAALETALDIIAAQIASGDCTVPGKLGECAKGVKECVSGQISCKQVNTPVDESCDGLDNNCDGVVDNNLTRTCSGACGGFQTCTGGKWSECSAGEPRPEECNGLDDDCDTVVDNGDPGGGIICATGLPGMCAMGVTHCLGGKIECVPDHQATSEICDGQDNDCDGVIDNGVRNACGTCGGTPAEICNGLDDDCDGAADNGATCPDSAQVCLNGECVGDCRNNECPVGLVCREMGGTYYCVSPCNGVKCEPPKTCDPVSGQCIDPCEGIVCKENEACKDGKCVSKDCHESGCPAGFVCVGGSCVKDPCADVKCKVNEYCSNGSCIPSCASVSCPAGQHCEAGKCVSDPCDTVTCPEGKKCVEGDCVDDPCALKQCGAGYICVDDNCVDDPCLTVKCPTGQVCREGDCYYPETVADGGVTPDGSVAPDGSVSPDGSTTADGSAVVDGSSVQDGAVDDGGGEEDGGHRDAGKKDAGSGGGGASDCSCSAVSVDGSGAPLAWIFAAAVALMLVVRRRRDK
jgi:MYXO-CTERM domain-containing protein